LPDIIPSLNHCSTRLKNTYAKQSKTHEINLIEYKQGLKYINSKYIEHTVHKACTRCNDRVMQLEKEISEELLAPLMHHQDFKSIDVFNDAWCSVIVKLEEVFNAVTDMERDLISAEQRRLVMIKAHLTTSFDVVKAVGHWDEAKICRYFDNESEMLNHMSISNFEQFTQLVSKLKLSTSHKLVQWRARWEVEILNWKDHLMERTVAGFDELINSPEYRIPEGIAAMHDAVLKEQQCQDDIILAEYSKIVKNLPYNKDKYNNFSLLIGDILGHKEEIYERFRDNIDIIFRELQDRVDSRFKYLRDFLSKEAGCSHSHFDKNFLLYLPGGERSYDRWVDSNKETKYCKIRDNLQHMAEVHSDMLQYLHSICNMWEHNQSLIKHKERELLEDISTKRSVHQTKLLKLETEIDNYIQKLKYKKSLPGINTLWERVRGKLEALKSKYSEFGTDVRELVAGYPESCLREVGYNLLYLSVVS